MTLGPVGTVAQALTTPSTRISMTHFLSIAHLGLLRWRGGHWPPASRALLDIWVVAPRRVAMVPRCLLPHTCGRTPADHSSRAPFGGKAVLRRESAQTPVRT